MAGGERATSRRVLADDAAHRPSRLRRHAQAALGPELRLGLRLDVIVRSAGWRRTPWTSGCGPSDAELFAEDPAPWFANWPADPLQGPGLPGVVSHLALLTRYAATHPHLREEAVTITLGLIGTRRYLQGAAVAAAVVLHRRGRLNLARCVAGGGASVPGRRDERGLASGPGGRVRRSRLPPPGSRRTGRPLPGPPGGIRRRSARPFPCPTVFAPWRRRRAAPSRTRRPAGWSRSRADEPARRT